MNVVLELGVAGSLTMNYNTNLCLCTLLIETYTSLVEPIVTSVRNSVSKLLAGFIHSLRYIK